jgi:hypothetical protein
MPDRFRPDAAARRVSAPEDRGHSDDRLIASAVDKAIQLGAVAGIGRAVDMIFEDRGPIGHVGRNSIPKSHRGEGFNYVD